jgi:lycopene cyclase domain-containing protein
MQLGNLELGRRTWAWGGLIPAVLVAILWMTDSVRPSFLLIDVPTVMHVPFLESSWTYAYLHIFTVVPVFLLSFDRNVHYYRKWKYLIPAILAVGGLFILWDVFFTLKGVWGFNPSYFLGVSVLRLPVEEWLFFVTVPFACVFIYECLNFYVGRDWLAPYERTITISLMVIFLLIGMLSWGRLYTSTTFLLTGGFLLSHVMMRPRCHYRSRFYLAFLVSLAPFLLVNGVLTGGYTREPVVIYNPEEYMGIRITSIPVDDTIYGFLLLFGVVTIYEFLRQRNLKPIEKG